MSDGGTTARPAAGDEHAIAIETLLQETMTSQRSLELGFKRSLGCTPHDFLSRERVGRAKELRRGKTRSKRSKTCGAVTQISPRSKPW